MKHQNRVVVSLFSGAGGMSLGFAAAGLKPSFAVDIEADACASYRQNLGTEIHHGNISDLDTKARAELLKKRYPFALIGGPPCQGFSSAGQKIGSDPRNKLIYEYIDLIDMLKPSWFIFENVEGMLTSGDGRSVFDLVSLILDIGYYVRLEKVNFAAYGVPQARKRVVIVGNRSGMSFDLPPARCSYNAGKHKSTHGLPNAPTFDEATAGLGSAIEEFGGLAEYRTPEPINVYDRAMRAGNERGGVTLHWSPASDRNTELYAKLLPGQTMKDLPVEFWHDSYKRRAYRRVCDGTPTERRGGAPSGIKRLAGNLNSLTITSAATREFIHPREHRPLTLREAARLQSFPDRFEFSGSALSIARQIGNAFPPLAAEVFARHLLVLDHQAPAEAPRPRRGALIGYRLTEAGGMSPALERTEGLLEQLRTEQLRMPFETMAAAV